MLLNNICLVAFLAASATAANLDNKVMISPANATKTADRKLQSPLPFLVAANDNNLDQLIVSDGAGSFTTVSDLPGGDPAQHYTKSVAICDMNGDGFADILSVDWITGPRMLINNGNNEFTASELPDNGGAVNGMSIICSDVDGDGDLDVVVGYVNHPNQLLFNDGSGSFTLGSFDLPGGSVWTNQVIAADMNGDGNEDIIMGNNEMNHLLINNGNGQFTKVDLPGLQSYTMTMSIAAADIDNDGDLDLIIGNENGATANYMLLNDGNGSFTVQTLPGGNLRTFGIYASDMNGDGNVDIIVGNHGGGSDYDGENQVLFGDGSGSFTVQALPGGDTYTTSVITADVDDDGDLDIIVANGYYDESQLLINDGAGSFALSTLPGGVDRATNYIAASFAPSSPPSSPQVSQLTANTWAVTYQGDAAVDFTSSSTNEVVMSYEIGAGQTPVLNLYASADCSDTTAVTTGVATPAIVSQAVSGDSTLDTLTVGIDINKALIATSNIWGADSSLEFCLAVQLESGGEVITEDLQSFDIAFNFDIAFSADTFAATADGVGAVATAAANVNDYISACKCDGTTCNASALSPDDLLQVCIMSSSSEVVVSQVTELDLAQNSNSMAVVDGGNIGNAALSELIDNGVKTVVPAKFFTSTDAISVSGNVLVEFSSGRRQLVAFGDNDAKSIDGRMMLDSPFASSNPDSLVKDDAHHNHLTVDPPSQEVEGNFDFEVGVKMATDESKFNAASALGITKVLAVAAVAVSYLW